jgi:predicted PurR-regulated permease PerM
MENEVRTQRWLHLIGLIAVTLLGLFLSWLIAAPFLGPLISAVALAVIMLPIHRRIEFRVKHAGAASGLTVVATAILVIGPVLFVGERLLAEATSAARLLSDNARSGAWRSMIGDHPSLAPAAAWIEAQINLPRTAENAIAWLTGTATSLVQGSGTQLVGVLITFYFLFYFLRDRRMALAAVAVLSPLSKAEMIALTARVARWQWR